MWMSVLKKHVRVIPQQQMITAKQYVRIPWVASNVAVAVATSSCLMSTSRVEVSEVFYIESKQW